LLPRANHEDIDQVSLDHSQSTLEANSIRDDQIVLLKAFPSAQILFPLNDHNVDIGVCNPPFYASLQELEEKMENKQQGPHAVSD
jgi:methyltransferase